MQIPAELHVGDELTVAWLNSLRALALSGRLFSSDHARVVQGPNGATLEIDAAGDDSFVPRFSINVAGAGKVTIGRGLVSGGGADLTPTVGATLITEDPAPKLTITANGFVYLEITFTGEIATAAEVKFAAAVPANTTTKAYKQLGQISSWAAEVQSFTTSQDVMWNISVQKCGDTFLFDAAP